MRNDSIQIFVATGRKMDFAIPSYCVPVETGSSFRMQHLDGYTRDDSGENISAKNHEYCELTALYWGWKNSDADIKGLCHYRRFFHKSDKVHIFPNYYLYGADLLKSSPKEEQIRAMLSTADIILPIPYNPYPKTVRTNLEAYVYKNDISIMEEVLQNMCAEYYPAYCAIMKRQRLSYCNMMIAKKEVYDTYCAWLFPLLHEIEKRTNLTGYDTMHRRIFGYLAEVLLPVYVEASHLKPVFLNLAQIWDLWNPDKKKENLVRIGNTIHLLEELPLLSKAYYRYSERRYPDIYHSYCDLRKMLQEMQSDSVADEADSGTNKA